MLTFCPEHWLCLHDRCPACSAPVAYHRSELGRPNVTDPGPLCFCHVCGIDLRTAERAKFSPYAADIGTLFDRIAAHVAGHSSGLSIGHFDVLHHLCKVMVSPRPSANLAAFAAQAAGGPSRHVPRGRQAFELRPVDERHHIVQLATWVLAEPKTRLPAAWQAEAVHYSDLVRDFPLAPGWYREIVDTLNRSNSRSYVGAVPATYRHEA